MNDHKKTSGTALPPRRSMHVYNVGPCFTCGCRNVCWFAGMGWDKVNHIGGHLSGFDEPPCRRLRAVPTTSTHRGLGLDRPVSRVWRAADSQDATTPAAAPARQPKASDDSEEP